MLAKQVLRHAQSKFVAPRASFVNAARVLTQRNAVFAMNQFSVRLFANAAAIEKSIQKLSKALDKEIKYENENYSQLEDIETFLNESGFTFHEQDNSTALKLVKKVGDKTVEVHFESR